MISHICGEVSYCGDGFAVIDLNGLGFQINVTAPTLAELRDAKEKIKLYTYLEVREDALMLFGFKTHSELDMFRLLIGVTRIGPHIALNILSQIRIPDLAAAIIHEDENVLTRIQGVGRKNARRLILELKDRIKKHDDILISSMTSNMNHDAVSALVSLGFAQRDARDAVEAAARGMKQMTVQALIKAALMKMKEK